MRRTVCLLVSAAFALTLPLAARASDAGLIDGIRKRQEGIRTIKASFTQEKHTELLERPIKSRGHFYFKSPVGVRWEYDDTMTVIYDGSSIFIHYIGLDEAEKIEGAAGFVGPLSFDIDLLLKDYAVKAVQEGGRIRLDLEPLKNMPFKSMVMYFATDSPFPSEVDIFEETGDNTRIRFSDVKTNVDVPADLLKFEPPPGVTVRERKLR